MKKIILCGLQAEYNLGGPSLLHGMGELLQDADCEILNIQLSPITPLFVSDLPFKSKYYDISAKRLLLLAFMRKLGLHIKKSSQEGQLLEAIAAADCIIDLFGICFCDNFEQDTPLSFFRLWKNTVGKYLIPYCGKLLGIKTVKNTASYGPMRKQNSKKSAQIASRQIFDCFLARETESQQWMQEVMPANRVVFLSPDTANLMPVPLVSEKTNRYVVISVSHQILKQWHAKESYWEVMTALCKTITEQTDQRIVLLPNEVEPGTYNDLSVAKELQEKLAALDLSVDIADVENMNGTQEKAFIAAAEVVIASRYHSCVAALSAGVPLLVLGWHNKYEDLMRHYGQDSWIFSSKNCTGKELSDRFIEFWRQRDTLRTEICAQKTHVQKQVKETFQQALNSIDVKLWEN